MQSCMLQMTCSIPIFNDRKLKELKNWLLLSLYSLIKGGPEASDILGNRMKWKQFFMGIINNINMTPPPYLEVKVKGNPPTNHMEIHMTPPTF